VNAEGKAAVARAFRFARSRMLLNGIFRSRHAARFRVSVVIGVSLLFWLLVFAFFWEGFRFLGKTQLINQTLAEFLFRMFFGSLLVMLIFSTGILLYGGLFASREAERLLASPAPPDHVFAFKFQEAMFFSSWGFMLLGSPMTLAFGLHAEAPASFHVFAAAFFAAFALLPGSLGALACLLMAKFLPRRRREVLLLVATAFVLGAAFVAYRIWGRVTGVEFSRFWLASVVRDLQMVDVFFLPSQWITRGLLAASFREPEASANATYYLILLAAQSGMAYLAAAWSFRRYYRSAFDRVQSAGESARHGKRRGLLATLVARLFAPHSKRLRTLIEKDVLTFLRDPLQWSQVMIFAALLVFYFSALGRMNYYTSSPYWKNVIGLFNIAVTGLILSTFTSRFVFPLVSLELQKFWILGLCPLSRRDILWSKFAFASGGSALVTVSLTWIGAYLLAVEPLVLLLQTMVVIVLCFGLSGVAVGLGAKFPELGDRDPSRIAAGFGGTVNLVASLLFLAVVIGAVAWPSHLYAIAQVLEAGPQDAELPFSPSWMTASVAVARWWLAAGMAAAAAVGAATTVFVMRAGVRSLERMEF
jgi:ABC-2 type transport system permease protein